jgi:O-antigen/teichoic acid export membrane protein
MMIGYEMSGIALAVGDRYVIEGTIGEGPLGLYAAAYNLCQYVQAVFIASVGQAIMPIYMQMWDQKGRDETSDFISRSLRRYLLFGAPVVAGLAAVGPELLPSLASDKYASAGIILPWVIAGMVLDGAQAMLGAGLFIHKKTRSIMVIVFSSAVLNIVLNIILIPRIGVVGAAIATLVAYAASSLAMAIAGRHLLPVVLPWGMMLRAGAASAVMYFAVIQILPGHRLLTVALRSLAGALIYAILIVLVDEDARTLYKKIMARLNR